MKWEELDSLIRFMFILYLNYQQLSRETSFWFNHCGIQHAWIPKESINCTRLTFLINSLRKYAQQCPGLTLKNNKLLPFVTDINLIVTA